MGNSTTKKTASPEALLEDAMEDAGPDMKTESLRLLISGYIALKEQREKPLNETELKAVQSMISYVAYSQGVCEKTVSEVLMATFHMEDVKALPSKLYPNVIEYLVELNINENIN